MFISRFILSWLLFSKVKLKIQKLCPLKLKKQKKRAIKEKRRIEKN